MDTAQAIAYGFIQGLTEFLPISSTAHIRILPAILGWPDPGAAFTAVTQIGTLVAVLAYFRADIGRLTRAMLRSLAHARPFETPDARFGWWIVLGTIPIIIAGLVFKHAIEGSLRSLWVIAASLSGLAALLLAAELASKRTRTTAEAGWVDAIVIGIAQAFALIPGASRSGVTITAGLFRNFTREDAARFSFLLSIPAVLLSGLYELYEMRHAVSGEFGVSLLVAVAVSAVVGYASIEFLLRYLRTHSSTLFIGYRFALGMVIFLLLILGRLTP